MMPAFDLMPSWLLPNAREVESALSTIAVLRHRFHTSNGLHGEKPLPEDVELEE